MRSWSKWVIFSRRIKSSSAVGPRRPIFREFWLSAILTPWFVVNACPVLSTRTRSSGSMALLTPIDGTPVPTLSDWAASLSVLAPASGDDGAWVTPADGVRAGSPDSDDLIGFDGVSAARSLPDTTFSSRPVESASFEPRLAGGGDTEGPAKVLRTEPAPATEDGTFLVGIAVVLQ